MLEDLTMLQVAVAMFTLELTGGLVVVPHGKELQALAQLDRVSMVV